MKGLGEVKVNFALITNEIQRTRCFLQRSVKFISIALSLNSNIPEALSCQTHDNQIVILKRQC